MPWAPGILAEMRQFHHAEKSAGINQSQPVEAGAFVTDNQISVLGLLRTARDLVDAGHHAGIIEAISALKGQASGPKRDMAYYAVLETASGTRAETDISILAAASRDRALALLDATIKRIASKMH